MFWSLPRIIDNTYRKDLLYLNEFGQTIDRIDLNVCQIMPVIPCIGARIKRLAFSGVVTEVFLDYTADVEGFEGNAAIITVKVDEIQPKD